MVMKTIGFVDTRNLLFRYGALTKPQICIVNAVRILTRDYELPEFDDEKIILAREIVFTLRRCNHYKELYLEYDSEFCEYEAKKWSEKEDYNIELLKKLIKDFPWLEIDFSTYTHLYITNEANGHKTRSEIYYE